MIACLLTLVVLAGTALAAWLALRAYGPDLARDRLEAALTQALGQPVRIERLVVRPWLGRILLERVRLEADPSDRPRPTASAERIQVSVGIRSLWRRELVLSRILVEDLSLRLVGSGPSARPPSLAVPDTFDLGAFRARLNRLEVRRALVGYQDPATGTRLELRGLTGTASPHREGLDLAFGFDTAVYDAGEMREVVEGVSAAAWFHRDQITIRRLSGRWHGRGLHVSGEISQPFDSPTVRLTGRGEVDLAALGSSLQLAWPLAGVAQGTVQVTGPIRTPELTGEVTVPELSAGSVTARSVAFRGRWRQDDLELQALTAQVFGGMLKGALATRLDQPERTRITATLRGASLASLSALVPERPGLDGRLDLDATLRGDPRSLEAVRGRIVVDGRQVTLPGAFHTLGGGGLHLDAVLGDAVLDLVQARGSWPGLSLALSGPIRREGPRGLRLTMETDMGVVGRRWAVPPIAGTATLSAEVTGPWSAPEATGRVRAPSLAFAGTRVDRVQVPFRLRGGTLLVDSAEAWLGHTQARLSGTLFHPDNPSRLPSRFDRALAFRAELRAPSARWEDLSSWVPPEWHGSGQFTLAADLQGTMAAWRGSGQVESQRLVVRSAIPIQALRATFSLDPERLTAQDVRAQVHGVPIHGQGTWAWSRAGEVRAEIGPAELARLPEPIIPGLLQGTGRARIEATIRPGAIQGSGSATFQGVSVRGVALGDGAAHVALGNGSLRGELAFPQVNLTGTASGRLEGSDPIRVRLSVRDLSLGSILPAFRTGGELPLDGRVTGVADLAIPPADPAAIRGTLTLDPVRVAVEGEEWTNRDPVVVRWEAGAVAVDRLNLAGRAGSLSATGRWDPHGDLDLEILGQVPLAILPAFRPEIRAAGGLVILVARATGTAAAPILRAEATLRDGYLQLRDSPESLRQLQARAVLSPEGVRLVEATASLGRGTIRASGDLSLENGRPGVYRALVAGQNISLTPVEGLQSAWDLTLEIVGQGPRPFIRGEGRLLRGSYSGDLYLLTVLLREKPAHAASDRPAIPLRLSLRLDNNLQVRTNVIQLRVDGSINVEGTTADPILFGRLESREGRITFRRHRWTVDSASARFEDPRRIDPLVDLTATTYINPYDVRMRLSGRTDELTVRLSSRPPLPEEELLSLVTLGVRQPPRGESGTGTLATEALRLFVEDLVGITTSSIGLDRIDLGTLEDQGQTRVRVGARVTEDVQVLYSQTMGGSAKRLLRVEYQVLGPLLIAGEQDFQGGLGGDVFMRLRFR
jgi:translocation and assembly module TamB